MWEIAFDPIILLEILTGEMQKPEQNLEIFRFLKSGKMHTSNFRGQF